MSHQYSKGIEVLGPVSDAFATVLTPQALDFVARLHRAFDARRRELLLRREQRQAELAAGKLPDFLPETAEIRAGPVSLSLPCRGLPPGPARFAVRPNRLVLVTDGRPNTLPGTVTKTTYAGSHAEVAVVTEVGPIFLVVPDAATLPHTDARVHVAFPASGAILLLD